MDISQFDRKGREMMYLSRIQIPATTGAAISVTTDLYRLHGYVLKGFSEYGNDKGRVLFRHDSDGIRSIILVQSERRPSWNLLSETGIPALSAEVKEYSPVMRSGTVLRFLLRANPVVTRNGRRFGLIDRESDSLSDWLISRQKRLGFRVFSLSVSDEGYRTGLKLISEPNGKKREQKITLKSVLYQGLLVVENPESFIKTIERGIGHGKGFGFGLLSIAKAE